MPTAIPPQVATGTVVVDLQTSAVNLACQLGSLHGFIDAAETLLLTAYELPPSTFRRQSKKVVTLIEIARKTLSGAGISPYFLCPGKVTSTAFKAAYIDLLHMLDDRLDTLDPEYKGRALSLLAPLYTQSIRVVKANDRAYTGLYSPQSQRRPRLSSISLISREDSHDSGYVDAAERPATTRSRSMPPPDAWSAQRHSNPLAGLHPKVRMARTRSSLAGTQGDPRSSRFSDNSDEDEENVGLHPSVIRPLRQKFGIYCTKNTSMYR